MGTVVQNILLANAKLLARSVMVVENSITISLCADLKIALSFDIRGIVPLNRTLLSKINRQSCKDFYEVNNVSQDEFDFQYE